MTQVFVRDVDIDQFSIGQQHEPIEGETVEELIAASLAMVRQGRRSVDLFTRGLDARIYDSDEFVDAIRAMVVGSRRSRVRMLVYDIEPIVKYGHRLVELSHRVRSFMELRQLDRERPFDNSAYLIVDNIGSVYRGLSDQYECVVSFSDWHHAQTLTRRFEEAWEYATVPQDLRRLHL